jgi:hypothetical protein
VLATHNQRFFSVSPCDLTRCVIAYTTPRSPAALILSFRRDDLPSSAMVTFGMDAIGRVFAPNSRAVQMRTIGSPRLQQIGIGMSYSGGPCARQAGWSSGFGRARSGGSQKRLRVRLLPHSKSLPAQEALERLKKPAILASRPAGQVCAVGEVRAETAIRRRLARLILRRYPDQMCPAKYTLTDLRSRPVLGEDSLFGVSEF